MEKEKLKEITGTLVKEAVSRGIRLPREDKNARMAVGTMLLAHRKSEGEFDESAALKALEEKYGIDTKKRTKKEEDVDDGKGKASEVAKAEKRKRKADGDGDGAKKESESKPKKRKTTEKTAKPLTCVNPNNQPLMEAFEELAGYEFKAHLGSGLCWKGIALRKVAKIMRETEADIKNGKQMTRIKGVGKDSGEKIDEFLKTGKIEKLEEFRNKV